MQKHVNLVDLVKSFPTNIYLENLASIQKRTSPVKFAHLAERSEKVSTSNLSTKVHTGDLTFCSTGGLDTLKDFNAQIESLPHEHKVVIAGNHDRRVHWRVNSTTDQWSVLTLLL